MVPAAGARRYDAITVEGLAGSGQCGNVYRARHQDGTLVALKLLRRPGDAAGARCFAAELLLLRAIKEHRAHPHLAELVAGDDEPVPYIATRFVDGGRELHALLGRPLAPGFVAQVVAQTADALDYLHAGHPTYSPIIHRDVKPSNILIDRSGSVVLIDLGIALHARSAGTAAGQGSVPYMAPEQHRGLETPATDQFALALIAIEMLTGRRLLLSSTSRARRMLAAMADDGGAAIATLLPGRKRTADVLRRALAIAPAERFASCGAFAAALAAAIGRDAATPPDTLLRPRSLPQHIGNLGLAAVGAGAAAMLLAALATHPAQPAQHPASIPTAERSDTPHLRTATEAEPFPLANDER